MDIILKERNLAFNIPNNAVVYNKNEFFRGFNIDYENLDTCVAIIGNSDTNDAVWIDEIATEANSKDFDGLSEYDSAQLKNKKGYKIVDSKLMVADDEAHYIKYYVLQNQTEYIILVYELYDKVIYRAHLQTKDYMANLSFVLNIMKSMTFINAKNL